MRYHKYTTNMGQMPTASREHWEGSTEAPIKRNGSTEPTYLAF